MTANLPGMSLWLCRDSQDFLEYFPARPNWPPRAGRVTRRAGAARQPAAPWTRQAREGYSGLFWGGVLRSRSQPFGRNTEENPLGCYLWVSNSEFGR